MHVKATFNRHAEDALVILVRKLLIFGYINDKVYNSNNVVKLHTYFLSSEEPNLILYIQSFVIHSDLAMIEIINSLQKSVKQHNEFIKI